MSRPGENPIPNQVGPGQTLMNVGKEGAHASEQLRQTINNTADTVVQPSAARAADRGETAPHKRNEDQSIMAGEAGGLKPVRPAEGVSMSSVDGPNVKEGPAMGTGHMGAGANQSSAVGGSGAGRPGHGALAGHSGEVEHTGRETHSDNKPSGGTISQDAKAVGRGLMELGKDAKDRMQKK